MDSFAGRDMYNLTWAIITLIITLIVNGNVRNIIKVILYGYMVRVTLYNG